MIYVYFYLYFRRGSHIHLQNTCKYLITIGLIIVIIRVWVFKLIFDLIEEGQRYKCKTHHIQATTVKADDLVGIHCPLQHWRKMSWLIFTFYFAGKEWRRWREVSSPPNCPNIPFLSSIPIDLNIDLNNFPTGDR